jgi:leader peptidase (prepilin peptidase)/N-methyltransferase
VLAGAMALLGLVVGSFLNVVINRVPRGESLIRPGSRCPLCGRAIRPTHNIPLVSWVFLRGRCFTCGRRIAVSYPLVELVTSLLFVAVTLRMSDLDLPSALPAYLYFAAIGVALAVIDLRVRRLPDAIVLPSYAVVAVLLAGSAVVDRDSWAFVRAVIGGSILFAFFFALAYFYPAGMGFGDVKLAGIIGGVLAYLSWSALVIGAFAGFLIGAVAGLTLMAVKRVGRKAAIPFGPWMIVGALFGVFAADPIARFYVDTLLGR